MTLLQKALLCLLHTKKAAHTGMEKKLVGYRRFVQTHNKLGEQEERQCALKNIEQALNQHA